MDPDNATDPVPTRAQRRGDKSRVETFTDGVFAIIITILVLEIGVPEDLSEQSLRDAIEDTGPTLVAWVISFLITGMYWVWHRDLFTQVRRVNRELVWINLLFLLPVCLIPFASSVLGEYHDDAVGLHVYGLVLIFSTLMRVVLYAYAMNRPELLWAPTDARNRRLGYFIAAAPLVPYLIAMIVAAAAPTLSLLLFLSIPLLYFILIGVLRDNSLTHDEASDFS
jgi:uncharacterized membrane protein